MGDLKKSLRRLKNKISRILLLFSSIGCRLTPAARRSATLEVFSVAKKTHLFMLPHVLRAALGGIKSSDFYEVKVLMPRAQMVVHRWNGQTIGDQRTCGSIPALTQSSLFSFLLLRLLCGGVTRNRLL